MKAHAGGRGHVVEASSFERQVIGAVRCANVIVVRSAVEREMSVGGYFFGVRVVGCFIRSQHIILVVDFNRTVQLVNRTLFFLLDGANCVDVLSFFFLCRSRDGAGG